MENDAQKANREYHAGKYQTHDPVTGEKRGPQGPFANIDSLDTFSKREVESAPVDADAGDGYDDWLVDDLRDEAASLDVKRADGGDGEPLKSDLIAALRKRDSGA